MAGRLPAPPVLQIERSQPVQGEPVTVLFKAEGGFCGSLKLPFAIWIRFNKLLHKGLERQQLEGPEAESAGLRVVVKGFIATPEPEIVEENETAVGQIEQKPLGVVPLVYRGGISNLAAEDEGLDPADAKAIAAEEHALLHGLASAVNFKPAADAAAKALEKLGQTLVEEEPNDNG